MTARAMVLFTGLIFCLLAAGCLRLERERPEKYRYLIDVTRDGDPRTAEKAGGNLYVRRVDVSQAFEAPSFVYRTGESSWESDYYHAFFVSPDVMLTEQVSGWLKDSGLFNRVSTRGSQVQTEYLLEGNVVALYGDYRDPEHPEAVIEVQLLLLSDQPAEAEIIFQGDYAARDPVGGDTSEDLVAAWNRALKSILGEVEQDLAEALAVAGAVPGES